MGCRPEEGHAARTSSHRQLTLDPHEPRPVRADLRTMEPLRVATLRAQAEAPLLPRHRRSFAHTNLRLRLTYQHVRSSTRAVGPRFQSCAMHPPPCLTPTRPMAHVNTPWCVSQWFHWCARAMPFNTPFQVTTAPHSRTHALVPWAGALHGRARLFAPLAAAPARWAAATRPRVGSSPTPE